MTGDILVSRALDKWWYLMIIKVVICGKYINLNKITKI